MALTNMRFKDQNWSHLEKGPKNVEKKRKREKKRRGRRRREEEKEKIKQKGMELTLGMNSCMNFHTVAWLLVVPKPRVC